MPRDSDSEIHFRWHELSQRDSRHLKTNFEDMDKGYTPKHLLGVGGVGYEGVLKTLNHVFGYAIEVNEGNEIPMLRHGNFKALPAGRQLLSLLITHPGLGERYDAFVLMQHPSASEELYEKSLDAIIARTNRILTARSISTIPTLTEHRFPLLGIKGLEDLNLG